MHVLLTHAAPERFHTFLTVAWHLRFVLLFVLVLVMAALTLAHEHAERDR